MEYHNVSFSGINSYITRPLHSNQLFIFITFNDRFYQTCISAQATEAIDRGAGGTEGDPIK